tara:strand:+ start:66 stop:296 length:231 start_codon:yes stop_codon:yes gene_type:complete
MKDCHFCRKYNMTESDFLQAIKDGKISTTVLRHDEVYTSFRGNLTGTKGKYEAVMKTSVESGLDVRTIYRIIEEYS